VTGILVHSKQCGAKVTVCAHRLLGPPGKTIACTAKNNSMPLQAVSLMEKRLSKVHASPPNSGRYFTQYIKSDRVICRFLAHILAAKTASASIQSSSSSMSTDLI